MPDAAIVSSIYDRYDTLKPACPQQGLDAEWVLVTDDPQIPDGCLGWRVVHAPRPGIAAFRAAKEAKLRPWEFTDAPVSAWVDASCLVTSPSFAAEAFALARPLAAFRHPWRDCLYDEAEASWRQRRYAAEPVTEQVAHYRERGHPEHWGLWATTILARRHGAVMEEMADAWEAEMTAWSSQDQVSFPYVLRNMGLQCGILPGETLGSGWHQWRGSERHTQGYEVVR